MAKFYNFESKQLLKCSMDEAWDFFATPRNLENITPDDFHINITSKPLPEKMFKGQIITYKMQPMPGLNLNWMTEITQIEEKKYFIDEQRSGPYKIWHHEHWFEEVDGGVMMTDKVVYVLPLGILGRIANSLKVGRQIRHIFEHRRIAIDKYFNNK